MARKPLFEDKPAAYMRRWAFEGEVPKKELNERGRPAWPARFLLLPVTIEKIRTDDVPLYPKEGRK